jgi:hypothetical protein
MRRDRDDRHDRGERGWTPPPRRYGESLAASAKDGAARSDGEPD